MYHIVKPCSDSGAYVAEPKKRLKLDMNGCGSILREGGFTVKFSSPVMLLVELPTTDIEVGIYPSGKLLFKTTDKKVVDEVFPKLVKAMIRCQGLRK